MGTEFEHTLEELCATRDLTFDSAKSFSMGDKNHFARAMAKLGIQNALTKWVRQEQKGGGVDA
jgi:hypothetical protein